MPNRRLAALTLAAVLSAPHPASAYEPRVNYELQCMGCHGAEGKGEPGRVPSFKETLATLLGTADGRRYLIRVPGVAQSPLSDQETAEVLDWMVQTLADPPAPKDFVGFTAEEVARSRHQPLTDVFGERKRLLAQSPR